MGSVALTGLACGSPQLCVAVDTSGEAFVGTGLLPGLPAATGRPGIKGTATQGDVLAGVHGKWSNGPTSYYPQWERCSAKGGSCKAIRGATTRTYKLAPADVGHAIRLSEQAANQAGYGPRELSAATHKVRPSPDPVLSRLTYSNLRTKHPELRFTLSAARVGPRLRSMIISLPKGMRYSAPRARRSRGVRARAVKSGLTIEYRGRALRFSARVVRGGVRIALRRATKSLQVVLRSPQLIVSRSLSRQLRQRARTLTLAVSLPAGSRRLPAKSEREVR